MHINLAKLKSSNRKMEDKNKMCAIGLMILVMPMLNIVVLANNPSYLPKFSSQSLLTPKFSNADIKRPKMPKIPIHIHLISTKLSFCMMQCDMLCNKLQPIPVYLGCMSSCLPTKCSRLLRKMGYQYSIHTSKNCNLHCANRLIMNTLLDYGKG